MKYQTHLHYVLYLFDLSSCESILLIRKGEIEVKVFPESKANFLLVFPYLHDEVEVGDFYAEEFVVGLHLAKAVL